MKGEGEGGGSARQGSVCVYHRGGGLSQRQLGTLQRREPRRTPVGIVHSRSTAGKGGRETPVAGQRTGSKHEETRARQVSSSQRGCGSGRGREVSWRESTERRGETSGTVRGRTQAHSSITAARDFKCETACDSPHRQQQAGRVVERNDRREQSTTSSTATERSTRKQTMCKSNRAEQN